MGSKQQAYGVRQMSVRAARQQPANERKQTALLYKDDIDNYDSVDCGACGKSGIVIGPWEWATHC